MTQAPPALSSRAVPPAGAVRSTDPPLARLLGPAWPITVLLVGYPVLWALGLSAFAVQILAVPMAIELWRRRPIRVPSGFGWWLLFLVCSLMGLLVLGVNPPDTVPDTFTGRMIGYGVRESGYIAITVMFLYVGNLSMKEFSDRRLIGQLSIFFVTAAVGGLLGLLWPYVSFTSPFELVMPEAIRNVPHVGRLIHPSFAQVHEFGGDPLPRPAAPFPYTNTWGSQISLLSIWFIVGWLLLFTRLQRFLGVVALGVALVCVVYSLNRGVWLGVLLGIAFVVLVLAIRGRLIPLASVLVALALAFIVVAQSPLKQVLETRLQFGTSNGIRAFTTEKAFELSKQSPVIGFGSTRAAVGSRNSIAVGKSPDCPICGNVSIGINGHFWTLLVSTGYAGVALFYGFWAGQAWRSRRDKSLVGVACQLTLLISVFYGFIYNVELIVPFLALAVMWRRRTLAEHSATSTPGGTGGLQQDGTASLTEPRFASEQTGRQIS